MKKGKSGTATAYTTRGKALAKLQLRLSDFRRLCILKGVFPREPKRKVRRAGRAANAERATKNNLRRRGRRESVWRGVRGKKRSHTLAAAGGWRPLWQAAGVGVPVARLGGRGSAWGGECGPVAELRRHRGEGDALRAVPGGALGKAR